MTLTEITEAIKSQVEALIEENNKPTKVARKRARSVANEIKKLAAEFKKTSMAEEKA